MAHRERLRTARLLGSLLTLLVFGVFLQGAAAQPAPSPSFTVNDVTKAEGSTGGTTTTAFTFDVELLNYPGSGTYRVSYSTSDGTAVAGSCSSGGDYNQVPLTQLTFNASNTRRTATVQVCADTTAELSETFFVNLSNSSASPAGTPPATIAKGTGTGTIVNDDGAVVRPTAIEVTCDPATVPVLGSTLCTATVTDTEAGTSTPKGTVTFSLVPDEGENGAFTPAFTCTLDPAATGDSNSCSVTYTPATVGDGTHEIGASYTPTDGVHAASSDPSPFRLTVRLRTTNTSVSCDPPTIEAGESTICTATVTDTEDGTSTPQGTVSFSATGSGNTFVPASCVLTGTTGDSNSCSVSYSSIQAATHTVTATYGGDLVHEGSSGTTDVIVEPGPPATITLDPATDVNPPDTQHCVTATVKDAFQNPTPEITVVFSVTGLHTASGSAETDLEGEATFCYTGFFVGTSVIVDTITAFADFDPENGSREPTEPTGAATKAWAVPDSTPLCNVTITEGGWIVAQNGDRASFGGNVHVSGLGQPSGQQTYQDHGLVQPMTVKSTSILAVLCSNNGKQATIFGLATIDGSGTFAFRIDVQDLREPGVGHDTYRMRILAYDSGEQTLRGGNVQIHKR
jgi:hypothetical protein